MRIKRIKLTNFAGIYAGTGLKDIDISFDVEYTLNLFLGANGKGKSVIMSCLTPFRETFDDRKDLIIHDTAGVKVIWIEDNEDEYKITHYYEPKNNKSYIELNGVELNDNGGVKSFVQIIKDKLGVDQDYFKIGKLGAGLDSFISMNSSDRKKYIGNFIPNIDDILEAYEVANSNFNAKKKELKKLEGEFEKLGDIETLKANKKTIETEIDELRQKSSLNSAKKQQLILESENIHADDLKAKVKEYASSLKKAQAEYKSNQKVLDDLYIKYANLKEYTDTRIEESLLDENNKSIVAQTKKDSLNDKRNELIKEYNETMDKLDNMVTVSYSEEDMIELQKQVSELNTSLKDAKDVMDKSIKTDKTLEEIAVKMNNVENYYTSLEAISTHTDLHVINESSMPVYMKFNEELYNDLQEQLNQVKVGISKIESLRLITEDLNKRPENCKINTCPFIKTALSAKHEIDSNEYLYGKEQQLTKKLDEMSIEKEKIDKHNEFIAKIIEFGSQWKVNPEDVIRELQGNISDDKFNKMQELESKQSYLMMKKLSESIVSKLETLNAKISVLEKDKEMSEKSMKEYKLTKEKSDNLAKEIDSLKVQEEKYIKTINVANTKVRILNSVKSSREVVEKCKQNVAEATEFAENNRLMIERSKEIDIELSNINKELTSLDKSISIHSKNVDELTKKIILAEDIVERYNKLSTDFNKYKVLRDTLDPKQGFPVLFIKTYLEDISDRVNELLNIAYDGAFQIKFNITAKDFLIEVYKGDGTMLNDIKQASQGEMSMTTVSLSLAIMEKSIDRYNIVYLDEVDATLSSENRRTFIDIVQKQIEKMGIEQVFIISHNNEYFSYPMNLVLLEGNDLDIDDEDLMSNKKIMFNIGG